MSSIVDRLACAGCSSLEGEIAYGAGRFARNMRWVATT